MLLMEFLRVVGHHSKIVTKLVVLLFGVAVSIVGVKVISRMVILSDVILMVVVGMIVMEGGIVEPYMRSRVSVDHHVHHLQVIHVNNNK